MSTPTVHRIVHLHVPKTAGTAFRAAFSKAADGKMRMSPHFDERDESSVDPSQYDFFSGHFGFKTASQFGGEVITVLRNPIDRFVSLYYFWRRLNERGIDKSHRTILATKFSLREFAKIKDDPAMMAAFHNTSTWQIAYGSTMAHRRELRAQGKTDADVVKMALANLSTFALVGVQERLDSFAEAVASKYSVSLEVKKVNVNAARSETKDLDSSTVDAIREWSLMDIEVYERMDRQLSDPAVYKKSA